MKNTEITHVCIVETVYTLFLYMILVGEKSFEHTFFFCSLQLPDQIRDRLPRVHCFHVPQSRFKKWLFRVWLYVYSPFRWQFIKRCWIYGSDNSLFSSGIIGCNDFRLIEDGASNYAIYPPDASIGLMHHLKKWFMGPLAAYNCGGRAYNVKKIFLTGALPIPSDIQSKVEVISVETLWKQLSLSYRNRIMDLFGISLTELQTLRGYSEVLFTQPMFEDGLLRKEEEIALYQNLLVKSNLKKLVIKVHPRDTLDYGQLFPDSYVLKTKIPMELLSILGVKFKEVYTVFSTAALTLPYQANIHFLGTSVHPNLLRYRGLIEYTL